MIYQDTFYDFCWEPTLNEAVEMMTRRGQGDLLKGMEDVKSMEALNADDDQNEGFQSGWRYEIRAYNVVFENMSKLFAPKENV